MSQFNSKAKPSHEVFAVAERKNQKSIWTKIGACWPHDDGNGFNLKLQFMPVSDASLVIRLRTEKPDQGKSEEAA